MATSSLKTITTALAQLLEKVLIFKPELEAMVTHHGDVIFREDWNYYVEIDGKSQAYAPFTSNGIAPGDVLCVEKPNFYLPRQQLESIWLSLDYVHFSNPLMHTLVADFLTVLLNEDQNWVKNHSRLATHVVQNYLDLQKLVIEHAPQMKHAYSMLVQDVLLERQLFVSELLRTKLMENRSLLTQEEAMHIYEVRGKQYENRVVQDFWDHADIQAVLNEFRVAMERIIIGLFPTVRSVAELSLHPAHGYDVFYATVMGDTEVVVKNLGDYRILHWELQK